MRHLATLSTTPILFFLLSVNLLAQEFDEKFELWPVKLKIGGTVVVCGGKQIPASALEYVASAVTRKGWKITAVRFEDGLESEFTKVASLELEDLQTLAFDQSNPKLNLEQAQTLNQSDVIWLDADRSVDAKFSECLGKVLEIAANRVAAGGMLVVSGSVGERLGKLKTTGFTNSVRTLVGQNLVPDAIIKTNYLDPTQRGFLLSTLAAHPRTVGIGIEDGTAIVLRGRKIRILGTGQATFLLMANEQKPVRVQHVRQAESRRANPYETIVDLTAWRRDAIERTVPTFPPAKPPVPFVGNGTLLIVGGGGMPDGLMQKMVDLAGGDQANMVYVPCSESDAVSENQRIVKAWQAMGVNSATFIHTKDRVRANSDESFLAPLKNATGVWFGGGRQWNFADSYFGTKAHRLMKDVLQRGGVIGGSSAGASVQARYMCRANPVANFDIMAPGYERGLGFIGGVAIDQHFTQRGRQKDMTQLVDRYPQLLGIGIDEATALIVRKSRGEVVGRGKVHFYDRTQPVIPGKDDFVALSEGAIFDLESRKVIEN